jgi:phospholipid transport system substrate-binding protein
VTFATKTPDLLLGLVSRVGGLGVKAGRNAPPTEVKQMKRRFLVNLSSGLVMALAAGSFAAAQGTDEAPDSMVKRLSSDVLETIKSDKTIHTGDVGKVVALVESKVMPHVNFERMTASAVGPSWRQASAEQKKRLQEEFKTLLVRTYSGALSQVSDQSISVKPLRSSPDDKEVVVKTEIRGQGDPIQLDYRLEKTPGMGLGWKIYNLNVLGIWLVETYRSQFAQAINANGIDGLITQLADRNKANAKKG